MIQLLSLTPMEYILIGLVVLGTFLFFRACWHNIQKGRRQHKSHKKNSFEK